MGARKWGPSAAVAVLYLVAPCGLPPAAAAVVPLQVRHGRCEAVLPTGHADDQFFLVVGSLAAHDRPCRVTVRAAATDLPVSLPRAEPDDDPSWRQLVRDRAERQARARTRRGDGERFPPLAEPPQEKTFHLFCGDSDFRDAGSYAAVRAALRAVGQHCQVYVDRDCPDLPGLKPTLDDAVKTFDGAVWPRAQKALGRALDTDRDGRFTILFSGRLGKLRRGRVSLGGFVRGSDFHRDLAAPFSNCCDMMYLNTSLRPGPHLRALLAHEYTHAVVFSEHVFGDYLPGAAREDEEGWLNEALAHLAEEAHGYGWSNLDYRVSAFLNRPQGYPLVVPDYYGSGLWRTAGTRGATYLFLRWCADRCGEDLPTELVQSNLRGVANLEAATRRRFAELFREWSVALLLTGSGLPADGAAPFRTLDPRKPLGGRLLCGPRFEPVSMRGGKHEAELAGTAAGYVLLHSPAAPRTRLTVTAEAGDELQVTLVVLPRGGGRLSLRCRPGPADGAVRLEVTAHGSRVRLEAAAWELLVPRGEGEADTSCRGESVQAWFGGAALEIGESRRSEAIRLPAALREAGPVVFKVQGIDDAGRRVTAWAVRQ